MTERVLAVKKPMGLHLRPAQELCRRAMGYESQIQIRFRDKTFNAKSLLSVLSACVQQEDEIRLICTGKDEAEAARALADFIEHGL